MPNHTKTKEQRQRKGTRTAALRLGIAAARSHKQVSIALLPSIGFTLGQSLQQRLQEWPSWNSWLPSCHLHNPSRKRGCSFLVTTATFPSLAFPVPALVTCPSRNNQRKGHENSHMSSLNDVPPPGSAMQSQPTWTTWIKWGKTFYYFQKKREWKCADKNMKPKAHVHLDSPLNCQISWFSQSLSDFFWLYVTLLTTLHLTSCSQLILGIIPTIRNQGTCLSSGYHRISHPSRPHWFYHSKGIMPSFHIIWWKSFMWWHIPHEHDCELAVDVTPFLFSYKSMQKNCKPQRTSSLKGSINSFLIYFFKAFENVISYLWVIFEDIFQNNCEK